MALFEGKTPGERNKLIAAIAFGAVALLLLGRMFFGGSDTPARRTANTNNRNTRAVSGTTANGANGSAPADASNDLIRMPRELSIERVSYSVPDAGRNIFAFYVAPVKATPQTTVEATVPEATPAPTPPLTLSGISPSNVTARTGDFQLQLTGDKFTPQVRVYVDGQELQTTFASEQQLSTTVPAALISAPGARQIVVRTPDNQLYSNDTALNVSAPPTPPFTFVGILGSPRYNDKAILKNQSNELITVQRGDTVAGRFKVTSISTRAVEFTDAQLQIKHTLPYVESRASGSSSPPGSPAGGSPRFVPPKPPATDDDDGDDEP
ncbi:MAG TPA: IPT/TIG domain-containing protein [Pyrinomonadaceae bacterium]|nr:IPT/TIG domain-containing protein [Pyrinomonadaceae bacterium]